MIVLMFSLIFFRIYWKSSLSKIHWLIRIDGLVTAGLKSETIYYESSYSKMVLIYNLTIKIEL